MCVRACMCVQGHPCVIEEWDGASEMRITSPLLPGYYAVVLWGKIIFSCEEFIWYVCVHTVCFQTFYQSILFLFSLKSLLDDFAYVETKHALNSSLI